MHRTFELRYIHGFNVKETAEALEVTVGTARVYLSRARARIKQELYKSSGRRKHPD
jgi:DNA-directed RNA polymerase specialized sigma24 family protein